MSKSFVFCVLVVMATVVHYSCGQCTTKYCEEGEEGLYKNLMEQNQYLLQEISRIREITAMQQQQYASLQAKQNGLGNDLNQVKSQQTGMQATQQQQQAQQNKLENDLNQLKSQQTGLQDEINKARSLTAFYVYMDQGGYYYPNNGDIIPFNGVITNIGSGFSRTIHKFRCPVSGVYAFWYSLYTGGLPYNSRPRTVADLMMGNTVLSQAHCYNDDSSSDVHMMCSNQAITRCEAGSYVWVQCAFSGVTVRGDSRRQTTFSGFLLRKD